MKKKKFGRNGELGKKFEIPDIERVGLFIEMSYVSGKYYPKKEPPSEVGPNMYGAALRKKDGTQAGYFAEEYLRIFSREALVGRGRKPPKPYFKNVSGPLIPLGESKKQSSPGDYYGCFSGNIEAFSNRRWPKPKKKSLGKNFYTNPGKKGNNGYVDIGLSKYPEHMDERYGAKARYKQYGKPVSKKPMLIKNYPQAYFDKTPFAPSKNEDPGPTYVKPKEKYLSKPIGSGKFMPTGPGKWQGGCHDGCFSKFPPHQKDPYRPKVEIEKEKVFATNPRAFKTFYTKSVLNCNVDYRLNEKTFHNFEPSYINNLVKFNYK